MPLSSLASASPLRRLQTWKGQPTHLCFQIFPQREAQAAAPVPRSPGAPAPSYGPWHLVCDIGHHPYLLLGEGRG